MKIGIDVTGLYGPRTGVENYIINIVKNLLEIDQNNEYVIYCRKNIPNELDTRHEHTTFSCSQISNRKISQQTSLPIKVYLDRIDVMFFPGATLSLSCPCRSVLTVHDIFPFVITDHMPKYHYDHKMLSFLNTLYWKWMTKIGCTRTDQIISVSASTKNDIVKVFSADPQKISVIHEAAALDFFKIYKLSALTDFKKKYNMPDQYILCVGTGTYKNLQGSINGFSRFKKKNRSDMKLIVIGPKGRIEDDIFQLIIASDFKKDIILWGYFPGKDLNLLYNAAEIFLFPSFYEGFGIPVLEAFATGTPVITSKVSSLPEIAGDAAILVDPYNPEEIAFQLERVICGYRLRDEMSLKGLNQTSKFTWAKAAKETLKILEQVGAE